MYRASPSSLLRKTAVGLALAALLLSLPALRASLGVHWLLAVAIAGAAAILVLAGLLRRSSARDSGLDLAPSELTTLTFPPERGRRGAQLPTRR